MKSRSILLVVLVLPALCSTSARSTVVMDWVIIRDAGNVGEQSRLENSDTTYYGGVEYVYAIGKYEVTNAQYCEFLNAVAATDTYGLYSTDMGSAIYGGIERSGSDGSYSYSLKAERGNNPVNYVDWYDALRFANWLHNGQPTGVQSPTTTEDGAYDMSLGSNVLRKAGAQVWLPSEDEWYKAAHYKGGATNAGYWDYATQSDTYPTAEAPPGGSNSANYGQRVGGHQVTDVGSYLLCDSAYGTFDQNGNVWEWTEALISDSYRGVRGSSWKSGAWSTLQSSFRWGIGPLTEADGVGFRVASIPEPATLLLLGLSVVMLRRKL